MKKLILLGMACCLAGCQTMYKQEPIAVQGTKPMPGASHFQMKQYTVDGQTIEDQMVFFDLNKNTLKNDDQDKLAQMASHVRTKGVKIRVEGHTDERGSGEYNIALGWRRAQAVKDYLLSQGVTKEQVVLVSYGKEKPIVYGHNETAWQLNRRGYVSLITGVTQ